MLTIQQMLKMCALAVACAVPDVSSSHKDLLRVHSDERKEGRGERKGGKDLKVTIVCNPQGPERHNYV